MSPAPADLAVGVIVLVALVTDLRSRRIPNVLTFGGMALGILANVWNGDYAVPFLGIGAAFLMMYPGFLLGGAIRAGDAKLLMAVGAFYGAGDALRACLFAYILNLPFGIAVLAVRGRLGNLLPAIKAGVARALGRPGPKEPPVLTEVAFMPVIAAAVLLTRLTPWLKLW